MSLYTLRHLILNVGKLSAVVNSLIWANAGLFYPPLHRLRPARDCHCTRGVRALARGYPFTWHPAGGVAFAVEALTCQSDLTRVAHASTPRSGA